MGTNEKSPHVDDTSTRPTQKHTLGQSRTLLEDSSMLGESSLSKIGSLSDDSTETAEQTQKVQPRWEMRNTAADAGTASSLNPGGGNATPESPHE